MLLFKHTLLPLNFLKYGLLLLSITASHMQSSGNKPSRAETSLEQAAHAIIRLYNAKDQQGLSNFIHPDIGVYFLYRPGTVDFWSNEKRFCFEADCIGTMSIPSWITTSLKTQQLPTRYKLRQTTEAIVQCESISRNGLFRVNNAATNRLLSQTIKKFAQVRGTELSKEEKAQAKLEENKVLKWENKSARIVLAEKDAMGSGGKTFIFYLTNISGRWYLTILDYISADCSV